MTEMVYQWKARAIISLDAQIAGEELERIRVAHNGRLTQENVVLSARSAASPIHAAFEWNDKTAAHQWRLDQASYMIRSITVIRSDSEDARPIRAFVNVERDADRSYTTIAHAMSDADLRQQLVARAWKELDDWRKRYEELVEFARIVTVIEESAALRVA